MPVDLQALIEPDETYQDPEPIFSHVIDRGDDERSARDIVFEARIFGIELTALCGHKFVPERNPDNHPICPKCLEIFEFAKDFRGV